MKTEKGYPQPFGVSRQNGRVNFAVQVPKGKTCELLLYKNGSAAPAEIIAMPESEGVGEVRFLAVEGLPKTYAEYNFRIGGEVCVDPFAKELSGKGKFGEPADLEAHELRAKLFLPAYDWEDDERPRLDWNEVIAYRLHIRGFTKHRSSGAAHKGTFAGAAEKIPYLKELGINQIQCMPVYEFAETDGKKVNYWGYGPGYYFAPKHTFAAAKSASRECKDMVKAFHRAGIEVVLEMPFTPDTRWSTALSCLHYYLLEYHIDGFLLNPYNVPWEEAVSDPLLKDVKLMKNEDAFQNVARRFLKGDENMVGDVMWALRRNSAADSCCNYITSSTGFTLADLVSYDRKHNEDNGEGNTDGPDENYSWNCGAEGPTRRRQVLSLRKNQAKNALLFLFSAQGTPCLLAGDEFHNSQKGNNNAYCQDNEIGWVNWNRLKTDDSLFTYVKSLIALRKRHGCLHRPGELKGTDRISCGIPDISYHSEEAWQVNTDAAARQLGILYAGEKKGDMPLFIAYNMHWAPHDFALPSPGRGISWHLLSETPDGFTAEKEPAAKTKGITLPGRSIVLLVGLKEEEKDKTPLEELEKLVLAQQEAEAAAEAEAAKRAEKEAEAEAAAAQNNQKETEAENASAENVNDQEAEAVAEAIAPAGETVSAKEDNAVFGSAITGREGGTEEKQAAEIAADTDQGQQA